MPKVKHRKTKKHKKKMRSKTFKKDVCSPKNKRDSLNYTCYTNKALYDLKKAWNIRNPEAKILAEKPKEIWKQLKYLMSNTCNRESCWIRSQCLKNNIDTSLLENMFAPSVPSEWKKNPREWLSTIDIHRVLKQWEYADKNFIFLGASPLDFDKKLHKNKCVWDDLCKFDLKSTIESNKTKIGTIFNLDKHTEDGSHWVAVYIDTKKHKIYFFDSYGDPAPSRIYKFCKNVKLQGKKMNQKYQIKQCRKRHQYKNGECGMYCLYFIITLLNGGNFDNFNKNKINDSDMFKLRKKYFNIK